ncbi:hypothetical protein [Paracoccus luteus]|uniref:hypothetical protein n=1 Tax=Paracoccus luteus TaxID=2508543 RepID=UPI00106FD96B|nr:hypothetical protein [Paracoccus luteus]
MKASVRCVSLALGGAGQATLHAQEKHGKREDGTSRLRRIRDTPPLVYKTLDLRAAYNAHMEGVQQNKGCKRPVLHFIIKMPAEVLTDRAPGVFAELASKDEKQRLMAEQAIRFIEETHGGKAVFAARVDRDEAGELVVDVFAAPRYEKRTKKGVNLWASPTKFGKELAEKHQDEILRRHPQARGRLTNPRAVGIALQAEFALFFERENGAQLTRTPKDDPRPDRLETDAFKAVAEAQRTVTEQRDAWETRRAEVEAQMARQIATVEAMTTAAVKERQEALDARAEARNEWERARAFSEHLAALAHRLVRWLKRDDLPAEARRSGVQIGAEVVESMKVIDTDHGGATHPWDSPH